MREELVRLILERLEKDVRSTLVTLEGTTKGGDPTQRVFAYHTYINPKRAMIAKLNT